MKSFLEALRNRGKLHHVEKTVDPSWEPASLAKWMYQAVTEKERVGLFFESVKGSHFPLVTGALGASTDAYAIALDTEPSQLNERWQKALNTPIEPNVVSRAPCQEVVILKDKASLDILPVPTWTPGKDRAPYLTTITVTKDSSSSIQNFGVYRTMVRDETSVVVNLGPNRQGTLCVQSFTNRGQPAPIAWVIAAEPSVHMATVVNLPKGRDEMLLAGGLAGRSIDLVKAKTIDLMVPANAEIIIEAEIYPDEFDDEGPFGEFAGYMGPVEKRPVARITAITHQDNPIYYGYTSQMPPSESTVIQSLSNSGYILHFLRDVLGELSVSDVYVDLTFGGLLAHGIVAIEPKYPGHAKRVGRLIAEATPLKRVTVVDPDIDIRDPLHLEWAMNSRYDPAHDTVIIGDIFVPINMDPSVRAVNERTQGLGSKLVTDATQKIDSGLMSLPSKEIMMRALEVWKEVGLPSFDIPKRALLRLDKS